MQSAANIITDRRYDQVRSLTPYHRTLKFGSFRAGNGHKRPCVVALLLLSAWHNMQKPLASSASLRRHRLLRISVCQTSAHSLVRASQDSTS
jgi:hypothetical protein